MSTFGLQQREEKRNDESDEQVERFLPEEDSFLKAAVALKEKVSHARAQMKAFTVILDRRRMNYFSLHSFS